MRTKKILSELEKSNIDALIITKPKNLYYVFGIDSGIGILTSENFSIFLNELDFEIYKEKKDKEDSNIEIKIYKEGEIKKFLDERNLSNVYVENIDVNKFFEMEKKLSRKLKVSNIIENLRMIKDDYEIECIKKACEIAKKVINEILCKINENSNEIEIAAEIEYLLRKNFSEGTFEDGILFSSGKNASKIHAKSENKKVKGLAIMDIGAIYNHYFSDITRTFAVNPSKEEIKVMEFVRNLELETIDFINEGMKASEIYNFAEEKIKNFGFKFYHSLGHGVGLDVHEFPFISKDSETIIKENMVFTIEPGIYKANEFGARFEDVVIVKNGKCKIL
ncbi:MAG: M24 family metallopeptidase [Candidatus Altarchaeaceae archaeon]